MASRSSTYILRTVDDIHKIPDLRVGVDLLRKYNIDYKGIKHKQDAIDRLFKNKDVIIPVSSRERPRPRSQKVFDEVLDTDKHNRKELKMLMSEAQHFLQDLPQYFQDDLEDVFPKYGEHLKLREDSLKSDQCSILVAGETGAGKSSFLNLILGGDFLPVATTPLGCTATFCELRRSDKKCAIVYDRSQPPRRREIQLSGEKGFRDVYKYMTEVDEDEESPYDRVEYYWPFPLLQDGMVIIDCPGIGGNKRTADRIYHYLEKAFGFIYVLNPGAIQKDRLEQLLSIVVNSGDEEFDASSTIFVCNKWDLVSPEEEQRVKDFTIRKLGKSYPGLRAKQTHYISVNQAAKNVLYDVPDPALDELLGAFRDLFPHSLKSRLGNHYRWMSSILKRSRYSIRVTRLMDAKSIEEKEKLFEELRHKIERLELDAEDQITDLKKEVENQIAIVKAGLMNLFRSPEFRLQFSKWDPHECPKEGSWRKVVGSALTKITMRLSYEINIWNVRSGIASSIDEKVVRKFKTDFELLEDQIKAIEGVMLAGETRMVSDLHKSIKKQMPVKNMWKNTGRKKDDDSPDVASIGGAVSSLGTLDMDNKDVRRIFKNYRQANAPESMAYASVIVLDNIMVGDQLRKGLQMFFGRILRGIDTVAKMIPDFLKADKHLMRNLNKEVAEKEKNLYTTYARANEQYEKLQGKLDMFYVRKLHTFDYSLKELIWDTRAPPLGSGSFADVYLCELVGLTGRKRVAVKKCRDKLDESNVTDILLEDRILRDLDHQNIVKYFGSTLDIDRGQMRWIMILECCDSTLKQIIQKGSNWQCPGKLPAGPPQDSSTKEIAVFVVQMCDGLQYLHNKGLVHRDLKPDNILIQANVLKLTDVGMARAKSDITGTIAGSPVYMAPEVLLQRGLYDHRADIYSLGIVLWELWYGMDAAEHMERQMFGTFEETIKRGVRPSLTLENRPTDSFVKLVRGCWEAEPYKRPAVVNIATFFEKYHSILKDE